MGGLVCREAEAEPLPPKTLGVRKRTPGGGFVCGQPNFDDSFLERNQIRRGATPRELIRSIIVSTYL